MELADEVLDLGLGPAASPRIRGWNVHSPPTTTALAKPYTMGLGERLQMVGGEGMVRAFGTDETTHSLLNGRLLRAGTGIEQSRTNAAIFRSPLVRDLAWLVSRSRSFDRDCFSKRMMRLTRRNQPTK